MVGPALLVLAGLSLFAVEREGLLERSSTGDITLTLIVGERAPNSGIARLVKSFIAIDTDSGRVFFCPPVPRETTFQIVTHLASNRGGIRDRWAPRVRNGSPSGAVKMKRWRSPASQKCSAEDGIVLMQRGTREEPASVGSRSARSVFRVFIAAE